MLTAAQKSDVRRHLGYPTAGLLRVSPAGGSLAAASSSYRFFQAYGRLEYKMNNLAPDEEARLTGLAYAAVALVGPNPNVGDQIGITLSGGNLSTPVTLTATMPTFAVGTAALPYLGNALAAAAQLNTALQAAGILCLTPYGTGPFSQNQLPLTEVAFISPVAFSISAPTGTGVIIPQITATGTFLAPSSVVDGITTYWGYVPILNVLEGAWAASSQNLDTMAAGPWKGRGNEAGARQSLYYNWRVMLSEYLEIPIYDGRNTGARAKPLGAMRFA